MKNLGYYNGKIGEFSEMTVPMGDRVNFFGDGVYDAVYSRNHIVFTLDEHIDRFYNSAKLLEINLPHSKEEFRDLVNSLVKKMDTGENFVYFQASRYTADVRAHVYDREKTANILINIRPANIADVYKKIKLITTEDLRFYYCNIKTLNLIPSVLYAQKAKDAGATETVLHRNGRVTECSHSNVHIIKNGTLYTAPLDNLILPGISRRHLINACKRLDIPVSETPFTLEDLYSADEVIITSVSNLCISAESIDGKPVKGGAPDILKKLQDELYKEFIDGTNVN